MHELIYPVIPPNEKWTFMPSHGLPDIDFESGEHGMTFVDLLNFITCFYDDVDEHLPRKVINDPEFGVFDIPFWGDHAFLERIHVNPCAKTITVSFGS